MPERVVIDASFALAYLLDESFTQTARAAVSEWRTSASELLVPSHFWIEITNSLVRAHAQPPADVIEDYVNLDDLGLRTVEPDRPLLLLAIDQMVRSGLTAYDAIYLALALSTEATLATLDGRLAQAAATAGLPVQPPGQPRASESHVAYGSTRPVYAGWSHTAIVGAHIAELRRQALAET